MKRNGQVLCIFFRYGQAHAAFGSLSGTESRNDDRGGPEAPSNIATRHLGPGAVAGLHTAHVTLMPLPVCLLVNAHSLQRFLELGS